LREVPSPTVYRGKAEIIAQLGLDLAVLHLSTVFRLSVSEAKHWVQGKVTLSFLGLANPQLSGSFLSMN
jgi:hypothetical protein